MAGTGPGTDPAMTNQERSSRFRLLPYPRPALRRLDPRSSCRPRGFAKRRELLRIVAVAGLNEPCRHDELGGGLDRDVEFDDGAACDVEEEPRCRIRGAGHKHRDVLLAARQARRDVVARPL